MRNQTALAPTREELPQVATWTVVEAQAALSEAIQLLARRTRLALVSIQLDYGKEEKAGLTRTLYNARADRSVAYLLQNIRPLVRKTDHVFLYQHSMYFALLDATLQGGAIVEERLWEALLWRVHNISEQELLRPTRITIGHSAYPEPACVVAELFAIAEQPGKYFGEQTPSPASVLSSRSEVNDLSGIEEELPLLARKLGVPYLTLLPHTLPRSVRQVVDARLAQELHCYPVGRERNVLTVAMSNPQDHSILERLHRETGLRIFPVLTHPDALERALKQLH
ncbi:MAG TPA: hypothetical protein VFN35_23400 [Ktedonobacteraceae bacterium]|nr:hypothetical protein [Ktedonobacteraceae bacterium]